MSVDLAEWPHVFRAQSGTGWQPDAGEQSETKERPDAGASDSHPVLLMLHGTGGNEHEIASLAELLEPRAAVLAPRGRVSENGMNRFFRRLAEGVFDVADVVHRAGELAAFVSAARAEYALGQRRIVAVGMSNGANIANAVALLHPDVIDRVISFSGMYPLDDRALSTDLSSSQLLLLNGSDDPMAPGSSVDRLESVLRGLGATVTRATRDGGHGIIRADVDTAREWLATG